MADSSLDELLRRELTTPLGMPDTTLLTPDSLELFDTSQPVLFGQYPYRGAAG